MKKHDKRHIKVLLIEDDDTDSRLVVHMLKSADEHEYEIKRVHGLKEAVAVSEREAHDIVISDLNLPDSRGLNTLKKLNEAFPSTAIIVITGHYDDDLGYEAIPLGAQEYFIKGDYDVKMLNKSVHYAVERKKTENALKEGQRKLVTLMSNLPGMVYRAGGDDRRTMEFVSDGCHELTGYQPDEIVRGRKTGYYDIIFPDDRKAVREIIGSALKNKEPFMCTYRIRTSDGSVRWLWEQGRGIFSSNGSIVATEGFITDITDRKRSEEKLEQSFATLIKTFEETVNVLSTTVETRDPYTAGHQKRVAQLSVAIAREMGFQEQDVKGIFMAASVHDIGKICVPIEILINPGQLHPIELSIIRTHPQVGFDILKNMQAPWPLARIVLQHHERMNGCGYPNGLKGSDILPEARIIAVADVVEAMASHRPYRPSLGIDRALGEIAANKEVLYDADVVEKCHKLFTKRGFLFT